MQIILKHDNFNPKPSTKPKVQAKENKFTLRKLMIIGNHAYQKFFSLGDLVKIFLNINRCQLSCFRLQNL